MDLMLQCKQDPALVYDEGTVSVYVFGGFERSMVLRSAEIFSLIRGKWRELPNMLHLRGNVKLCKINPIFT